jgi:hypothetical protein
VIEIDYAKAVELVEAEIAEKGEDYVYERNFCVNVHQDSETGEWCGSCLIGRALIRAGIPPETFSEKFCVGSGIHNVVDTMLPILRVTAKAVSFFDFVQRHQDAGTSWGKALEYGKMHVQAYNDTL